MQKLTLFVIASLWAYHLVAQNLIPNPSFESPQTPIICGIYTASDFNSSVDSWYVGGGTPDLYSTTIDSTCFNFQPNNYYTGPIGIKGSQSPRTGNIFAGLFVYTIPDFNQREYIQVQLTSPLQINSTYCLEFYASYAENHEKYTDRVGGLFTQTPISGGGSVILVTPQIESSVVINDTINWVKVSGSFMADQAYEYLTIGNFYPDSLTNTYLNPGSSGMPGTYGAYYFIDDVSVVECNSAVVNNQDHINYEIYPNPCSDFLNIKIDLDHPYNINIYDLKGTLLIQKKMLEGSQQISLQNLSTGVYIMEVSNKYTTTRRKLIKH